MKKINYFFYIGSKRKNVKTIFDVLNLFGKRVLISFENIKYINNYKLIKKNLFEKNMMEMSNCKYYFGQKSLQSFI